MYIQCEYTKNAPKKVQRFKKINSNFLHLKNRLEEGHNFYIYFLDNFLEKEMKTLDCYI